MSTLTPAKPAAAEEEELVDFDEATHALGTDSKTDSKTADMKKGYVGIHSTGFRDFLLKTELLQAITDCGFEHPSEVQQDAIPQALTGADLICQAKSGMGKTAVFVLATLQKFQAPTGGGIDTLVLCHTRELAYQICAEFLRFGKYMPEVKAKVFIGGIPIAQHYALLKADYPNIVIGTPGRLLQLINEKKILLNGLQHFVMDECDKLLDTVEFRKDVQSIFLQTPREKQVMMFSATLSKEMRVVAKKFTQRPVEIYVDDESKLTLHGLQQYYVKLTEAQKNRKLTDLLDQLEFSQVMIYVNGAKRCKALNKLLVESNFPSIAVYGKMKETDRLDLYNKFKNFKSRILVTTELFGRGVDFEHVNIVFNYDMPKTSDAYLHRVGRSGRFGTKGLSITFVATPEESKILESVQSRFLVAVPELPAQIDVSSYMSA